MEQKINKIIENFNKDFNVNVEIKDKVFLRDIFQNFINLNMSSMISNEMNNKILELEEKIEKILGEDNKLFEDWNEIQDNYLVNIVEQAFIYGVCTYKELNSEIDEPSKRSKEEEQQILKHFDATFNTKVANHIDLNIPFLKTIFNAFEEEIFKPNEKYEKLRRKQIEKLDKLHSTLTTEQKYLYRESQHIENLLSSIEDEQLFYFGFIMAKELEKEGKV